MRNHPTSLGACRVVAVGDGLGRVAVLHLGDVPALLPDEPVHRQDPEVIEAFQGVEALLFAQLSDRPVLVAAGFEPNVAVVDVYDGQPVGEALSVDIPEERWIATLAGRIANRPSAAATLVSCRRGRP